MRALMLLCWLFACVSPGFSDNPASTPANGKDGKPSGYPLYGKVSAVDKEAKTITLASTEKIRVFHLTPSTRIHRNKTPARLDDVVIGQWIGGYVRPDTNGRPTLVTLNLAVQQRPSRSPATNTPPRNPQKAR